MISKAWPGNQAGLAFDTLAMDYDAHFTDSHIGRAQRDVVWREARKIFPGELSILELNCGTGEDALFLASLGHQITALDASRAMIDHASMRKERESPDAAIDFRLLPTEYLAALPPTPFDAVFSNFSGLNCVRDLREVATQLAKRMNPGSSVLLCFSTRVCLWETAWYLLQARFRKAFRRWPGCSTAVLNGVGVTVYYPTVGALRDAFAPYFALQSTTGVGIFVPPSYLEPWVRYRPQLLSLLVKVDRIVCKLPVLRSSGDHVLLHLTRTAEKNS